MIGTLGGVFEILFWFIMLLYGCIRENVYLFSVINSLIEIHQNHNVKSRTIYFNNSKNTPISTNRSDQSRLI